MILCADCGADLSNGTGLLTHETSACPMCGHQVFERYEFEERFGLGVEGDT
jgi:predicted RNA-binding Zn-ribbon protein involved in translation (DUF1610 family)